MDNSRSFGWLCLLLALTPTALSQSLFFHDLETFEGYVFTPIAGVPGVSGSTDGPRTGARFNAPQGLTVDQSGNLYVTDPTFDQTIRKIAPDGSVTTLAGLAGAVGSADGIGSEARFHQPYGIAVDGAGVLYVGDAFNSTIRKVTPNGVVTTLAGSARQEGSTDGPGAVARFRYPQSLALDSHGNIFVGDYGNATIRKVTPSGVVTTFAGFALARGSKDGPGAEARFEIPYSVAIDSRNNVFVADNGKLRRITPDGMTTTIGPEVGNLAIDNRDNIYFLGAPGFSTGIRKLMPDGSINTLVAPSGREVSFKGTWVGKITADHAGNLYVTDPGNNIIHRALPPYHIPRVRLRWEGFQPVVVHASSNLVDWLPIWTNSFTSFDFEYSFIDQEARDTNARFYRARTLSP